MTAYTIKEKLLATQAPDGRAPAFYAFELLRFLCAFLIVWGHLGAPFAEIAYFGLDMFIILNVALSTRSALRHQFGDFMARRVVRILIPWLGWSLFYLLLRGLRDGPASIFQFTDPLWLLIGPEIHLWYLPFVLLSAPFAYAAMHLPHGRVFGAILIVLAVPLCCAAYSVERAQLLPEPFAQWAFAFPPLIYAICRVSGRKWAPTFVLIGTQIGMLWLGNPELVVFLIASAVVFELFLSFDRIGAWAKPLGDAAFGIYLLHPFFIMILTHFMSARTEQAILAEGVFLASWAGSFVLGVALKRFKSRSQGRKAI